MKKTIWIVVGIVILVGVLWAFNKNNLSVLPTYLNSQSPSPSIAAKVGSKTTTAGSSSTSPQTYTQLVNQYVDKTIQFNDQCQGVPGRMVLKKGTKVLLDNRSSISKTILMDKQTFKLGAYGYQVVTVTTDRVLPYDLGIDCRSQSGSGENTVDILIQASILQLLR